jgi:hypothetical protein
MCKFYYQILTAFNVLQVLVLESINTASHGLYSMLGLGHASLLKECLFQGLSKLAILHKRPTEIKETTALLQNIVMAHPIYKIYLYDWMNFFANFLLYHSLSLSGKVRNNQRKKKK